MTSGSQGLTPHFISDRLVAVAEDGTPQLITGRCRACGARSFPRADVCTECLSEDVEASRLRSEGTLYSFSVVHQAPKGWNVPYALGYVDLPEGLRVLAHLDASFANLRIDGAMKLALGVVGTDPIGAPLSTYTFVPA
ncbi:putative OB-fold protein [Bradyrhizobium sp. AZCC 1678]|uniref:Zn-ribbon domain-containing OB-fold protein n=1 Tax=Bradyrhizobium sp. AZCC 1678 TaxID=3117030 RepID=UPI002FF23605